MKTINIKGMRCGHCEAAVTKALSDITGISEVEVNLVENKAYYKETNPIDLTIIKEAIEKIGFEVVQG